MGRTVALSALQIFIGLVAGLSIIIIIGLSTGLAGRKNNCYKPEFKGTTTTTRPGQNQTQTVTATIQTRTTAMQTGTTTMQTGGTGTSADIRTTPGFSRDPTIASTTSAPITDLRLPTYLQPSNYKLLIKSYFNPNGESSSESERFEGTVEITMSVTQVTRRIVLHKDSSLKLSGSITLRDITQNQAVAIASNSEKNQLLEIMTNQDLSTTSTYLLTISYTGTYGPATNLNGFYLSSYLEDGVTKKVAGTKFEPTDARKAFPCFDEPALKATYEITIEHPANSIALSNWPSNNPQQISGRLRTTFEKTEKMSTYLAAWAIVPKDFGFKETTTSKGVKVKIYARKEVVNSGQIDFALDVAKNSIDYFENEYFQISEALPPKVDLIGFPQFSSGAMEHWGLIGFRETNLIYSDKLNSISSKQSVAYVVAHELAHFWFGNLITCRWWDELWLNEGMARFLQFKAVNKLYPTWGVNDQFLTSYEIPVMFDDSFESTHPVSVQVNTPDQINSVFDSITYDKGSSLLRMLEATVGEDNFRDGLRSLIRANLFGVADANAFYNTLKMPSAMGSTTAKQYMENWLLQINYPYVEVQLEDAGNGQRRVRLTQNRFIQPRDDLTVPSPFNYNWLIYMKCSAGGADSSVDSFDYFLSIKTGSITLNKPYTWIMCNKDFSGYYLTLYSINMFNTLSNALLTQGNPFNVADRSFLIHNSFALAFNGKVSYSVPSILCNFLEQRENNHVPLRSFSWHVGKLASFLEHRSSFNTLSRYSISMIPKVFNEQELWMDTGSHQDLLLKSSINDLLCRMQNAKCLVNATNLFNRININYFTDPTNANYNPVPPNLRSIAYRYHTQNTEDANDFFHLISLYESTPDAQEKNNALNAISYSRSIWFLDEILESLLIEDPYIGAQDFFTIIVAISRNPTGRHYAWYFIRENWKKIVEKFGLGSRALGNAVKSACETFESKFLLDEMRELFDYTFPGAGEMARKQALEQVRYNIKWVAERENDAIINLVSPIY